MVARPVLVVAIAACASSEPAAAPASAPASPAAPGAPAAPAAEPATVERDTPAGRLPRELAGLPAPDASAATEDVPAGATCRIGSPRLATSERSADLAYVANDRLLVDGGREWSVVDPTSGARLDGFELPMTVGSSPRGGCVAVLEHRGKQKLVQLLRMPKRERVAERAFPDDHYDNFVLAEDCSAAMQRARYANEPCVTTFGAGLVPRGELCVDAGVDASVLSGDGRRIALVPGSRRDNTYNGDGVHVFDAESRREVAMLPRTGDRLGMVALSHDGALVAFVDGGQVRVVRVPTRAAVSTIAIPAGAHVRGLVMSPAGKRLAMRYEYESHGEQVLAIAVVDVTTGAVLFTQRGLPLSAAARVVFSPDGARLAYEVETGVRVVDAFTGDDVAAPGRLFGLRGTALSVAGDRAVISSVGHLSVWDTRDCSRLADLPMPLFEDVLVEREARVAFALLGRSLVRVDLVTGARKDLALPEADAIDSKALSPDGTRVVLGIEDTRHKQQLLIVDATRMKIVRRVRVTGVGAIGMVRFAPEGKRIVIAAPSGLAHGDMPTGDTTIAEVDVASGHIVRRIRSRGVSQSYTGALLDGGRTIAVEGSRYARATGKALAPLERTLYAVSADGTTVLWSAPPGALVWPASEPLPASPPITIPLTGGRTAVGREAAMTCDEASCVVSRLPARAAPVSP